ncbi:RNA polymerase sigma factor SigJ [Belnapia rosea]|uniref:RNA polymerase sigma-70 factor, ECF subfamily n=1 Tax=Belnapia rosea TaxID=938405 RepID=A0A1G6P6P2_9PROT|nr:RNA polymerase sigma factor SigJ [Belnapia rosea]SDC75166.1 RNA polymerase sigma-70 factor, ECF subfamily [Belnapia rosea]
MQQVAAPAGLDPFLEQRPRLLALAYRMLGMTGEAEEAVQDAWLRWQGAERAVIADPAAWLVTVTTRLCLDRLRQADTARRRYVGPWLPEPWLESVPAPAAGTAPDRRLNRAADLSVAFLLMLERLSAPERAALVLRDAFDADYAAIAEALGRTEAACRQILHRARARLQEAGPSRQPASSAEHQRLLGAFLAAARSGDPARLMRLLAEDARCLTDGGGKVRAALNPIVRRDKVARFVAGVMRHLPDGLRFRPITANGQPGLAILLGGEAWGLLSLEVADGRIQTVYMLRNPDKLAGIMPGPVTSGGGDPSWRQRVAKPPAQPKGRTDEPETESRRSAPNPLQGPDHA